MTMGFRSAVFAVTGLVCLLCTVPVYPESGRMLCVLGNQVVELDDAKCQQSQAMERSSSNRADQVLDRTVLDIPIQLLELDLLEGIAMGARYRYRVAPAKREAYFTRLDRYDVQLAIRPDDLFNVSPVIVAMDAGSEILFAQQFASGQEARDIQNVYFPDKLPVSADRALTLKPGDYARFTAQMHLKATLGQAFPLVRHVLTASAGVSALVGGEIQVHVFRLDQQRVRLKLVAERENRGQVKAKLSRNKGATILAIDERAKKILGISELDRSISLAIGRSTSSVFLVDYTLDLSKAAVRQAYDQVFSGSQALAGFQVASPLEDHTELKTTIATTIEPLDLLARQGDSQKAVLRNFKGTGLAQTRDVDFRVALKTYDIQRERIFRESFLSRARLTDDGTETVDYFLLPTWTRVRERSAFFGKLDENLSRTADALFLADSSGRPTEFLNIGFNFEYSDSILRRDEYRRLRQKIELLLPHEGELALQDKLQGTAWLSSKDHRNMRMRLSYFFRQAALDGLVNAGLGENEALTDLIYQFVIDSLEHSEFPYANGDLDDLIRRHKNSVRVPARIRKDRELLAREIISLLWGKRISSVSDNLVVAFDKSNSNKARMNAVIELRDSPFYRRIGTALWAHMINAVDLDLENVMYLELILEAQDHDGVEFVFGHTNERQLYEAVRFIEAVLNDRSFDMREEGEVDSIISRMRVVSSQ